MKRECSILYLVLLLSLILMLGACTQSPASPSGVKRASETSVSTETMTLGNTPTPYGGSSAKLGPVPQTCPSSLQPKNIDPAFGPAIGADPVWVGAGNFNELPHTPALITTPRIAQLRHQPQGWNFKFLIVVAAHYRGQVEITARNLKDGLPLQYAVSNSASSSTASTLVLDTRNPAIPNRTDRWTEFPGGILVPEAGCYAMVARWTGGSWRYTFAAGVGTPTKSGS